MEQTSFIEQVKIYNNINENIREYVTDLLEIFPNSFVNENQEFIAVPKTNLYFILNNCNNLLDIKCKVLEWFSRDAYKARPFRINWRNEEYQDDIREKINDYLGTDFTRDDMKIIYCKLGNAINHNLTIEFINSGYDMKLLSED